MISRFSDKVLLATQNRDGGIAREYYDYAEKLPQTKTVTQLKIDGIYINGTLISHNEHILVCFKGTVPCILKITTQIEAKRLEKLKEKFKRKSQYIVESWYYRSAREELLVVMPLMPTTLEQLKELSNENVDQLWNQMKDALEDLHQQGFVHMDVKTQNICIDSQGNFVLIDLGSVVEIGNKSSTTQLYHPHGLFEKDGPTQTASPSVDWWMLAAVVSEIGFGLKGWGEGSKNPSQADVSKAIFGNSKISTDFQIKIK